MNLHAQCLTSLEAEVGTCENRILGWKTFGNREDTGEAFSKGNADDPP